VPRGTKLFAISSQSKQNLRELLFTIKEVVEAERQRKAEAVSPEELLPVLTLKNDDSWKVEKTENGFLVTGRKIERFAQRTDFGSTPGLQRLRDIMRKMGIMHQLVRSGIEPGDRITIADIGSLEY
jgi:GTP-binding protein